MNDHLTVLVGDALTHLKTLRDESVQCCVTSPPYWGLRDYGCKGQIGLEATPDEYVKKMVKVFREVRRVLKNHGTCWLNLGDTYAAASRGGGGNGLNHDDVGTKVGEENHRRSPVQGLKEKDLCGIPWRVAFALQADGWYLREDIIWSKPNPMPESVTDRCTKSHEYIFLLTKQPNYFYDHDAIKEPATYGSHDRKDRASLDHKTMPNGFINGMSPRNGTHIESEEVSVEDLPSTRNKRSVWTIPTHPYKDAHFATFNPDLIKPCILAGTSPGDVVLDPFAGSGTTGMVSIEYGRKALLIELNKDYIKLIEDRCNVTPGLQL